MKKFFSFILCLLLFASCEEMLLGPEPENNPNSNFEVLWKTLDQNYALFPVKNINWDSLHSVYAARISPSTSSMDLWKMFGEILHCLNDGHVVMVNNGISQVIQSSVICKRKMDDFSLNLVKNKFLDDIKTTGKGNITYGRIKPAYSTVKIGYIYISTFTSPDGSNWGFDIDNAVKDLYDCDALIIDLRNNGGGLKCTLAAIASVFINRPVTYFYQQEKTGPGHNDFGNPIPLTIAPRENVLNYTKKIALLTNRFSASGSEHFSQIFNYLPYTTQIGDTTFGCYGDIVSNSELPNGWVFWYPVRLTRTPEGYCPEGIGIIPDIVVENTRNEIENGKDNVMNKALNVLSGRER